MALYTQFFIVNGLKMQVDIEEHPYNLNRVVLKKYKEKQTWSEPIIDVDMSILKSEFIDDISFLFNRIDGKVINDNSPITNALADICDRHIEKHGRLLKVDLETYLSEIMYVLDSCTESMRFQPITEEQGLNLKNQYRQLLLKAFVHYII